MVRAPHLHARTWHRHTGAGTGTTLPACRSSGQRQRRVLPLPGYSNLLVVQRSSIHIRIHSRAGAARPGPSRAASRRASGGWFALYWRMEIGLDRSPSRHGPNQPGAST